MGSRDQIWTESNWMTLAAKLSLVGYLLQFGEAICCSLVRPLCYSLMEPFAAVWSSHLLQFGVAICCSLELPFAAVWSCHLLQFGVAICCSLAFQWGLQFQSTLLNFKKNTRL